METTPDDQQFLMAIAAFRAPRPIDQPTTSDNKGRVPARVAELLPRGVDPLTVPQEVIALLAQHAGKISVVLTPREKAGLRRLIGRHLRGQAEMPLDSAVLARTLDPLLAKIGISPVVPEGVVDLNSYRATRQQRPT